MSTVAGIIQRGTRGSQPAATAVSIGTLYCVTDESNLVERSNGTIWQSYSASGAGTGTVTNTGTLTATKLIVGNGSADVTVSALTATVVKTASGVPSAATAGTDYVAPIAVHGTLVNGRLTTETGVPVSTADRTAQATIYFTPYNGNQLALYTSSVWVVLTFSELSLALSGLTSGKNYDVFVDYNAGTPQLVLSAAWASDTTRTDAIALQDGVYVKSGTTTYRLVGTIRTTGATTTEDSITSRFVWNLYNRTPRSLANATETTDSWAYSTATWRQSNANTANELRFVAGVIDMAFSARASGIMNNSSSGTGMSSGIGVNTTSANSALHHGASVAGSLVVAVVVTYEGYPRLGYNFIPWLEYCNGGSGTFYGDANLPAVYQSGIIGTVWN